MALIRIPASSANLGPGFDCLGLALNLYNYIAIEQGDYPLKITLGGSYQDGIPMDESNLVYRSAQLLWNEAGFKPSGITLHMVNNIPPSRGLGSSSAAIIGGLYGANLIAGSPLSKADILELGAEIEGHPDNVAPALYGGATIAVREVSGNCLCRSLGAVHALKIVVAVPVMHLSTKLARSLLPNSVPFADAVWNLGRTGLVVASFLTGDYTLLKSGMDDRLHEQYRSPAIPGMTEVLAAAKRSGALAAVLSGAGPSMLALVPDDVDVANVGDAMHQAFASNGIKAEIIILCPDTEGAVQLHELPPELQAEQAFLLSSL